MAQLGKFEITRQDGAGNPVVSATIVLRKQGATVQSGGPTSFTVDDPGGLLNTDTVNVYNADGTDPVSASVSVVSHTASNVTVGGGGFSAANNARISPSTALPTIYRDAQGNETTTLTTDSNGYATGWVEIAAYDVVSTGGSSPLGTATTKVWFDVYPSGAEKSRSNAFFGGSTITRIFDTTRVMTAGDKFFSYKSLGTEKWYIDLNAALAPRVPAHNVAGLLTIDSGGLVITAGTMTVPAGGLTVSGGAITTAAALTIAGALAGVTTLSISSDLTCRRLIATAGTTLVAGDFALSAGWGTGATITLPGGFTPTDTHAYVNVNSGSAAFAALPTVTLTFKNGAFGIVPFPLTNVAPATNDQITVQWQASASTTQASFIWQGTPIASKIYSFAFHIIG